MISAVKEWLILAAVLAGLAYVFAVARVDIERARGYACEAVHVTADAGVICEGDRWVCSGGFGGWSCTSW